MKDIVTKNGVLEIWEDGRLYNALLVGVGYYKLKKVPLQYKLPYWDYEKNTWRFPFYRPWHRWRMSPGDGEDYIGGLTISAALTNMIRHYGQKKVVISGKLNTQYILLQNQSP